MDPLISDLRESHHSLREYYIGNTHPHDEKNLLVVAPLIEDEELERCEYLSQRLKESLK
jgi:hypothetical protein